MQRDRVDKYLDAYALPGSREAAAAVRATFSAAVVIPARDETPEMIARFLPALAGRDALAIVVVNGDDGDGPRVHEANAHLLTALRAQGPLTSVIAGVDCVAADRGKILVVDCASPGRRLPPRQGVGRARRIGCDLALALWRRGAVARRFIDTSDADAILPPDYFDEDGRGAVAIARPFTHVPCGDAGLGGTRASHEANALSEARALHEATALYELTLRYYVAGLARAGSPWAMHTVGSCLSVDADAYAAVRGFPVRTAGEDFYLLAKVAKLGAVVRGCGAAIRICARWSARVPFGTGPGAAKLARALAAGEVPGLYDPASFAALRCTIGGLRAWCRDPSAVLEAGGDVVLRGALADLRATEGLAAATRGARTGPQRWYRACQWFDAFRTLKFIHCLRERGHAPVPWPQAVAALTGAEITLDVSVAAAQLHVLAEGAPTAGLPRPPGARARHG